MYATKRVWFLAILLSAVEPRGFVLLEGSKAVMACWSISPARLGVRRSRKLEFSSRCSSGRSSILAVEALDISGHTAESDGFRAQGRILTSHVQMTRCFSVVRLNQYSIAEKRSRCFHFRIHCYKWPFMAVYGHSRFTFHGYLPHLWLFFWWQIDGFMALPVFG